MLLPHKVAADFDRHLTTCDALMTVDHGTDSLCAEQQPAKAA